MEENDLENVVQIFVQNIPLIDRLQIYWFCFYLIYVYFEGRRKLYYLWNDLKHNIQKNIQTFIVSHNV